MLDPASDRTIAALAEVLGRHPDWIATIEGHTDSIGTSAANQTLSEQRAAAVREQLVGTAQGRAEPSVQRGLWQRQATRVERDNRGTGPQPAGGTGTAVLTARSDDCLYFWRIIMRRACLRCLTVPAFCAGNRALRLRGWREGRVRTLTGLQPATTHEADAQLVSSTPWPSDPCAWVTAAEVTSTIGPLAGPPRAHEGDCLFPLEPPPPDAETLRRQEAARKLEELARKMGSTMPPDRSPTEPAVIVGVEMRRSVDEQAIAAAENIMASWAGVEVDSSRPAQRWDVARSPITIGMPGFFGRSGELSVMVRMQAISLPKEKVAALAAVVRDRVPDHPFLAPPDEQPLGTPDRARVPTPAVS